MNLHEIGSVMDLSPRGALDLVRRAEDRFRQRFLHVFGDPGIEPVDLLRLVLALDSGALDAGDFARLVSNARRRLGPRRALLRAMQQRAAA